MQPVSCATSQPRASGRLSYKFQRLREQLRSAIQSGEFHDRLPGERELGKRYRANAKTINKALCDLANEGLLVRHIGRGTFVADGRNGEGQALRPKSFVCLTTEASTRSPHHGALLEKLAELLRAKGHEFQVCDWPPSPATNGHAGVLRGMPPWHAADAVISLPIHPLCGRHGRLGEAAVGDILRRQAPLISIGACNESAKAHAVTPDFVDAGFRLSEYLLRLGCEVVTILLAQSPGRETELVVTGAQAAAARHQATLRRVAFSAEAAVSDLAAALATHIGPQSGVATSTGGRQGILCVGAKALEVVLRLYSFRDRVGHQAANFAAVLEPGDPAARNAGLSHYDVSPERLAGWAARLLLESRPGQRPTEIIVPGSVQIVGAARDRGPGAEPVSVTPQPELAEVFV